MRRGGWALPRAAVPLIAVAVFLLSCGSSPAATGSAPASGASPTAAPSGPAAVAFTFNGTDGLTGNVSTASFIRCDVPSTSGTSIDALVSTGEAQVYALVTVEGSTLTVSLRSGSGSSYTERDFTGTVTGVDPATGGTFSASLSAVASSAPAGNVGSLTSMNGTFSCGGQTRGSSTLMFTGSTSHGAISGGLNPARVECDTSSAGNSVSAIGVLRVGGLPGNAFFTVGSSTVTVFATLAGGAQLSLTGAPGSATMVGAGGAHVQATLADAGHAAETVTVAGDLTCGSHEALSF